MAIRLFRNLALKVVSVILAALLWLIVSGEQTVERVLRIPLEYTNIPAQLELVGEPPTVVDVRVRGSSGTLGRLHGRRLHRCRREGGPARPLRPACLLRPGFYPVVRQDEAVASVEHLAEMQADTAAWTAIAVISGSTPRRHRRAKDSSPPTASGRCCAP